ncbi:hypothetical protein N657DRAFT_633024 [Parathielavia appendiculata]|uniref:Zn(2)-C6 fungal-type domain-containing protein n=1 Tax=Parathielavia appendiculata TaxID=2587402 RepID=A0AAN6Z597_9PEZI|nr:hypothetical protein N657DRAFT_633024 [Parathielavia appendiculata]
MAEDYRRGRVEPPRDNPDDMRHPPPPDGEDRRRLAPVGPDGAALPPMPYPPPGPTYQPDSRYQERPYPSDPRYQSDPRSWPPEPAPSGYPPPPDARYPAPFPPQDPRQYDDRRQFDDRRPYDDRRQYEDRRQYDDQRLYDDQRQYGDRRGYSDPYYDPQQAPPGRGGGYGPDYYRYPPAPYPYGMGPPPPPPPQQQSAPRQRTSIACRYCRKRKIRCSGYTHTTNGKCTNCDKLRIDCIFQPVSSNSSAAFVPVSAVPGGVPPGTPLYGAYGQPLPPSAASAPQPRNYPYPPSEYTPPMHSPTGSSFTAYDDKDPGRRRTRPPEEEHSSRPPPPNYPLDDDPRRRSPVSIHSNGTPPAAFRQFQQSPYGRDRPPTPNQNSPGRSMPPQPQFRAPQTVPQAGPSQVQQTPSQVSPHPTAQPQPQPPSTSNGYSNPMSLGNLIDPGPGSRPSVNDIDRNMLGRLNRRS